MREPKKPRDFAEKLEKLCTGYDGAFEQDHKDIATGATVQQHYSIESPRDEQRRRISTGCRLDEHSSKIQFAARRVNCCQLIALVRYVKLEISKVSKEIIFCEALEATAKGGQEMYCKSTD